MFTHRFRRLPPILTILALLTVAPLLTACEAGLPSADEIAERIAETYRDPGQVHVVTHTATETEMNSEMGALRMSMAIDAEQWQDGPERVRSESHMSLDFETPEDDEASYVLAMFAAFGPGRESAAAGRWK